MRRVLPVVAVLVVVALWGLRGIPGAPADCVPACDCETVGTGAIRQPAAAWSSLAIVAAGAWVAARPYRRSPVVGAGIATAGIAAFVAHASVASWAYDLDGAAVVLVAWIFAATEWWSPPTAVAAAAVPAAIALGAGPPASLWLAGAGAAALAVSARRRWRSLVPGAVVLTAGLVLRALTDTGGPWCPPGSGRPGHAAWHLLAAAGLALAASGLERRSAPGPRRAVLPSGLERTDDDP